MKKIAPKAGMRVVDDSKPMTGIVAEVCPDWTYVLVNWHNGTQNRVIAYHRKKHIKFYA